MTDAGELRILADDLEMDGYLAVPSRLREIADRLEGMEAAKDILQRMEWSVSTFSDSNRVFLRILRPCDHAGNDPTVAEIKKAIGKKTLTQDRPIRG
jgi:hypothetical protein